LSRMNFPAAQDLSAHFSPPRLLVSSHHSFRDPPNDHEYQPLTANSSSQNHAKRPPTHHRLSRGSSRPFWSLHWRNLFFNFPFCSIPIFISQASVASFQHDSRLYR
jgi:hypothetical protein